MASNYQTMAIVFLFLGVLAGAFAGNMDPITIHQECKNGIDDDGSAGSIDDVGASGIDVDDVDCFYYPMSDGNGESFTDPGDTFQSLREYPSLFEYHRDYGGPNAVCLGFSQGLYEYENKMQEADIYLDNELGPTLRGLGGC